MYKQTNKRLALLAIIPLGIIILLSPITFAQLAPNKGDQQVAKPCSGEFVMPPSISVGEDTFENYLKVMSSPRNGRQSLFQKLSNKQKAIFFKVHFALLLANSNLNKEQKDFVLESLLLVTPDLYDSDPQKKAASELLTHNMETRVQNLFARKEASEIIEPLLAEKKDDIALLQNYEEILKSTMPVRKAIVNNMSLKDKVGIWKTQLVYHLAASSFSRMQKAYIADFIPRIQSVFEASTDLPDLERAKYLETLEASLFNEFTKTEAFAVFMAIGIQKLSFGDSTANNRLEVCNCRWTCIEFSGVSCGDGYCNGTTSGCGAFGTWSCTNRCQPSTAERPL